jgi:hypothetical protein
MGSVINLVAAGLGYSLVPASLRQVQVTGVAYRDIEGLTPVAKLALASRRGETSDIVRNFMARAGQSARDNTLQLRVWRSQALHSRRKTIDAAQRQELEECPQRVESGRLGKRPEYRGFGSVRQQPNEPTPRGGKSGFVPTEVAQSLPILPGGRTTLMSQLGFAFQPAC